MTLPTTRFDITDGADPDNIAIADDGAVWATLNRADAVARFRSSTAASP